METKRRLLIDRNYPIGHDVDKFFSEPHDHNYYEFLFIIRGSALNVINDEIQVVRKGDLIAVRPGDIHYIKKIEAMEKSFEFFNIPVPAEYMEEEYIKCDLLKEKIEYGNIPRCVRPSNTEFGVLCGKAVKLAEMSFSLKREYLYFCLVKELCSCFVEYSALEVSLMPNWFSILIYDLESIEPEKLSYEVMLKKACMSKSLLCKTFKKYLGLTPTAYINRKKMNLAYELVIGSEKSLLEIATDLDYGSYTHFRREFVKCYGSTPNSMREMK